MKLPNNPEKGAGLRKLLEAKDCIVRASVNVNRFGQTDALLNTAIKVSEI